jgi:hypothetical protein
VQVKIRFGVGLGAETTPNELPGIVDRLEASGVDSLWFAELVDSQAVDPFVGMAYALALCCVAAPGAGECCCSRRGMR